jgi:hypothetical protein
MYYFSTAKVKIATLSIPSLNFIVAIPFKESGNWQYAASECCKMGMHLTAIERIEEFGHIFTMLGSIYRLPLCCEINCSCVL